MRLFFPKRPNLQLVGYIDTCYLSSPHKGRSQTRYFFTYSSYSEIIVIHEINCECIWLRIIQHIRKEKKNGLSSIKDSSTKLFEDNAACITQIRRSYIKGDRTKHISRKFFNTHELQKSCDIDVKQIQSSEKLIDLFIKSLPVATLKEIVHNIGMH